MSLEIAPFKLSTCLSHAIPKNKHYIVFICVFNLRYKKQANMYVRKFRGRTGGREKQRMPSLFSAFQQIACYAIFIAFRGRLLCFLTSRGCHPPFSLLPLTVVSLAVLLFSVLPLTILVLFLFLFLFLLAVINKLLHAFELDTNCGMY